MTEKEKAWANFEKAKTLSNIGITIGVLLLVCTLIDLINTLINGIQIIPSNLQRVIPLFAGVIFAVSMFRLMLAGNEVEANY